MRLLPRLIPSALACAAALVLTSTAAWSFPWDIDMYRGQNVQPLAVAPRVMPEGTMPVSGGEVPMTREMMTMKEKNPLQPTPENIAHGKELFITMCVACHGDNGRGLGPVARLLRTPPADLVGGLSKDLPDGYIYGTVRAGGISMPAYGDAMSASERWQVTMFVRQLQHGGAGVASK